MRPRRFRGLQIADEAKLRGLLDRKDGELRHLRNFVHEDSGVHVENVHPYTMSPLSIIYLATANVVAPVSRTQPLRELGSKRRLSTVRRGRGAFYSTYPIDLAGAWPKCVTLVSGTRGSGAHA